MQLTSTITTRLQYQHKSLPEMMDGLSEEQVRRNVVAGKWSIFENIVHLQTYQHQFSNRLKQILKEENPAFTRYTAGADPFFLDNCNRSIREIMQDYISVRKEMVAAAGALSDTDLQRTGDHPFFGVMNIPQWLNFFLLHEAHHLFTILKISAEIRRQSATPDL
jgi:hypothetical protein